MVNPFQARLEQRKKPIVEAPVEKAPEEKPISVPTNPFASRIKERKPEKFPSPEEEEREIERNQAQATSRILETILGAPGDIASFGAGLFGKEQKLLPTSQQFRNFSEKATLGYTKPKNEFEEKAGELFSDVASMAFPGTGAYGLARNIGIPIVGNLVKEGIKYGSGAEKSQAYGKVGTMVALDLLTRNKGGLKGHINSLYEQGEKAIPKGVSIDAKGLEKSLVNLKKEFEMGGARPTTKKSLEKIGEILGDIKNGKIDAKSLAAYRPAINELITELGGFSMEVPRKLKGKAISNLNKIKGETIKTLEQYGEKFNPEFLKFNRAANEAYAAVEKSNLIANFLKKKIPYMPKSEAVHTLFSYAPLAAATGAAKLGAPAALGATGALGTYNGIKVLLRIKNSEELRKYYGNILKAASAQNIPEATRNLKALDKALEKEE